MCALAGDSAIGLLTFAIWWVSILVSLSAYKDRKAWNVGEMPWAFLALGFLSFGIREFVQFFGSPILEAASYLFGVWAAVFLLAAFAYLFRTLYQKKGASELKYLPFAANLAALLAFAYLYASGAVAVMGYLEAVVWILQGTSTVYIMYMLATRSTGGFIRVYFLAQVSAYFAVMWKVMALLGVEHYVREFAEMFFMVFAGLSVYSLASMLRRTSRRTG